MVYTVLDNRPHSSWLARSRFRSRPTESGLHSIFLSISLGVQTHDLA